MFSRYEKHRQLILEEIFTSLARLPTSKRSLRNFRYIFFDNFDIDLCPRGICRDKASHSYCLDINVAEKSVRWRFPDVKVCLLHHQFHFLPGHYHIVVAYCVSLPPVSSGWTARTRMESHCTSKWWRLWCCSWSSVWSTSPTTKTFSTSTRAR